MEKQKLYLIGLYSFLAAVIFTSILALGIDNGAIEQKGLTFNVLVVFANVGLFTFIAIGVYLWLCYFNNVYRSCSLFVLWLYVACLGCSGYWAHNRMENGYIK